MTPRFERLLKERIGLDVESVGRELVERAIRLRMQASGCRDVDEYWLSLESSHGEQQALVEAVVVPETWFFRYPESFVALARLAFERLPRLASGRPLRVLSLPCSSGEEPYSIVMALLDAGFAPALFQVDALDVSEKVLERARQAVYGRNSFRGEELGFRDRHFLAVEEGHVLTEQVRRKVNFRHGNLLGPGLLAGEAPYDFVFCRNLLIYFDRPTQSQVLAVLKRLMCPDGALFVGPAEASLLSQDGMRALDLPQSFVFLAGVARAPRAVAPSPRVASAPVPAPAPAPRRAAPPAFRPAPVAPRPAPVGRGQEAAGELLEIARLANGGNSIEARAACERHLAAHGPSAAVFYWLGLLCDVAGQQREAQDYYRKTLYLEPGHAEALAHLAALLAARGDLAGARRLQERASRGVSDHDR
ncbi:protein-glutamate O-methyltransferase CheR [Pseudomonas sp. No.21]|jgi:chemotaxis protein methyltransferase WspC|uniref:CheR family methyltransferase n=1 Tax=Pseudomonas TaxID=286 RepID=UPI000DA95713|nr:MULTISPECIES: protein-glutamate O-methyltransferase CheR [Pseudomonas]MDW3712794.1 protein-glutamate O-methyltransferase CheR [Pseudomonas sp. 2023EL-01195]PZE12066.1 chemotaxis protein CheR [Pseudomonas sp. 57B-090624]GJN45034.1 putative biofilm formation methyltransferase WspC [Pseudomonas tohonis]